MLYVYVCVRVSTDIKEDEKHLNLLLARHVYRVLALYSKFQPLYGLYELSEAQIHTQASPRTNTVSQPVIKRQCFFFFKGASVYCITLNVHSTNMLKHTLSSIAC